MTASGSRERDAAVLASFLGWTLDAFDFFLVVMTLTAIAREFHRSDAAVALSLTLTLAGRPLGAFVFGLLADRFGRRIPLIADLLFYSAAEVLTGLAPTFGSFLVLRALFGIGMGGEWGVGASLALEKVPPRLRGLVSGLLQQGYAAGYLLAALCYALVFPRFGWRPLFFLGGLPALLALYVRSQVRESAVWERTRRARTRELAGVVARHWRLFLYLVLFMALMNGTSHGTQDLYPTFLERTRGLTTAHRAGVTALSMLGALAGGIYCGHLSDRVGRRRVITLALVAALALVPVWAFAPSLPLLVAAAVAMQFFVQGAWGVIPAHITELAPEGVRALLPGFAYQCGALVAGSIATIEATLARDAGYARAMALVAAGVMVVCAATAALGPERRGAPYGGDAATG
jgi:MFS transporter, SHS family, lactate transporter